MLHRISSGIGIPPIMGVHSMLHLGNTQQGQGQHTQPCGGSAAPARNLEAIFSLQPQQSVLNSAAMAPSSCDMDGSEVCKLQPVKPRPVDQPTTTKIPQKKHEPNTHPR